MRLLSPQSGLQNIRGVLSDLSEDDLSHLDIFVYEEDEENLYVHHDIILPAFPLCLAWLDYHPTAEGNKGAKFNSLN
jgi:periodic tryptophan protein 1